MMPARSTEQTLKDPLNSGHEALAHGDWQEAHAYFTASLRDAETPEALEGLGMAAWWLDDAAKTFTARERAYHLYRQRGEDRAAARVATYLAYDYCSFRGDYAIANGWLQRAHHLLEEAGQVPEQGLLAFYEGHFALMLENDTVKAQRLAAETVRVSRVLGVIDLEMLGLALEGLALVSRGDITEGMRRLDEATTAAVSGEMTDPDACATACCYLIYACERVRDYDRAAQWCNYVKEVASRWSHRMMFSLCRTHYAGVLIWRGDWVEAEATLLAATNDLVATRPAEAAEGILRLADLRRRQGRFEEAAALLAQAESHPFRMLGSNRALLAKAALAFDQGDPTGAVDFAEQFLRSIAPEDRTERPAALELLVLAHIARGDQGQAQIALADLDEIAALVATKLLQATAKFALGIVTASRGEHETARRQFEDAVDLYIRSGVPFEAARARIELARSLLALSRNLAAEQQARAALEAFHQLGALPEAARAANELHAIESASQSHSGKIQEVTDLTPREQEVLRLIAAGKSNQEIAVELVLSVRTVERHVSNIYEKIGASGKTARAAATAYALLHGLNLSHRS